MISSAVAGIIGQRLIRTICPECKNSYYPTKEMLKQLGLEVDKNFKLSKGKGCQTCYDSGFKGRIGIYELIEVDQDLQRMILENPSGEQLKQFVDQKNIRTILREGIDKVVEGVTTFEEVNRAIHTTE